MSNLVRSLFILPSVVKEGVYQTCFEEDILLDCLPLKSYPSPQAWNTEARSKDDMNILTHDELLNHLQEVQKEIGADTGLIYGYHYLGPIPEAEIDFTQRCIEGHPVEMPSYTFIDYCCVEIAEGYAEVITISDDSEPEEETWTRICNKEEESVDQSQDGLFFLTPPTREQVDSTTTVLYQEIEEDNRGRSYGHHCRVQEYLCSSSKYSDEKSSKSHFLECKHCKRVNWARVLQEFNTHFDRVRQYLMMTGSSEFQDHDHDNSLLTPGILRDDLLGLGESAFKDLYLVVKFAMYDFDVCGSVSSFFFSVLNPPVACCILKRRETIFLQEGLSSFAEELIHQSHAFQYNLRTTGFLPR